MQQINRWLRLTEEACVNMEDFFDPNEYLSLDQWLEQLYESLMMYEDDDED